MELENLDQYLHTLFLIEDLTDDAIRIANENKYHPLRKKLFLASKFLMKQKLENQVVTYELSRTKQPSK
jgi:hypothetical protein